MPEDRPARLSIELLYDPELRVHFDGHAPEVSWTGSGRFILIRPAANSPDRAPRLCDPADMTARPAWEPTPLSEALAAAGMSPDRARKAAVALPDRFDAEASRALFLREEGLFCVHLDGLRTTRLTETGTHLAEPDFSPDGRGISFVHDHDLWCRPTSGTPMRLTHDGSPTVFNGQLDWVYQEEIYGRGNFRGYWWSPDSRRIAFLRLDDSSVGQHTLLNEIPVPQGSEATRYPLPGEPNPSVRLGVATVPEAAVTWMDLTRYTSDDILIVDVGWTPDGQSVIFQIQDREQTWLDYNLGDPRSGQVRRLFRETSAAWVHAEHTPRFLPDGSFIFLSERSGWRHLYHASPDGSRVRAITSGDWEVREFHGIDGEGRLYFSGTRESPTSLHVYSTPLGGEQVHPITTEPGTHVAKFDPQCRFFLDSWSDLDTPPRITVRQTQAADSRHLHVPTSEPHRSIRRGGQQLVQLTNRDGRVMDALLITPPSMEPGRKYPVVCPVYGGPHTPLVRNAWLGTRLLFYHLLAQQGFVVWVLDNYTASGKGFVSESGVYRRFGHAEIRDIEDGLKYLDGLGCVDLNRAGIWGGSYGGFMVLYAMTHRMLFRAGAAVAPVTNWRLYDSIYTERYMSSPASNPEGYFASSPVHAAAQLNGHLLLAHGAMDDNVHLRHTLHMAHELQKAGKPFEFMLYPTERHAIDGAHPEKHLRSLLLDFFVRHLNGPGSHDHSHTA